MNTQPWTLFLYKSAQDWEIDNGKSHFMREYYYNKHAAEQARQTAEHEGYWTRIFAPDGELLG